MPVTLAAYVSTGDVVAGTNSAVTPTFNVTTGDVLVALGYTGNSPDTIGLPTWNGTGTWTLQKSVLVTDRCAVYVWTCPVTATATGRAVTFTRTGGAGDWRAGVNVMRGGAVGNSVAGNGANGTAPSVNLTQSVVNAAVIFGVADWDALTYATRPYRSIGGTTPAEQFYVKNGAYYTAAQAYVLDAGATGTETLGLTNTWGNWSLVGIEITPTTATTTQVTSTRATTWRTNGQRTSTRAVVWEAEARVTSQRAAVWNTISTAALVSVTSSRASSWAVAAPQLTQVTSLRVVSWNVARLPQVTSSRTITWAIAPTPTGDIYRDTYAPQYVGAPSALFVGSPLSGQHPLTVQFVNQSVEDTIEDPAAYGAGEYGTGTYGR